MAIRRVFIVNRLNPIYGWGEMLLKRRRSQLCGQGLATSAVANVWNIVARAVDLGCKLCGRRPVELYWGDILATAGALDRHLARGRSSEAPHAVAAIPAYLRTRFNTRKFSVRKLMLLYIVPELLLPTCMVSADPEKGFLMFQSGVR